MNGQRDVDTIIATWLDDGPVDLPMETRRAISVGLRTQPRARRMAFLGGFSMLPLNRVAVATVVVLAVGAGSIFFFANRSSGPGGVTPLSVAPSASPVASPNPSPSGTPSPVASISTGGWVDFSSARYGYDISHPPNWTATQADRDWSFELDQKQWLTTAADAIVGPPRFTAFAVEVPAGTTNDAWIASYYGPDAQGLPDKCEHVPADLATTEVDGHPVEFWTEVDSDTCGGTAAFVFIGQRVYVMTLWFTGQEALLEAMLSTVTFRP